MINRRLALHTRFAAGIVIATRLSAATALASDYPNYSIEIIVPFDASGTIGRRGVVHNKPDGYKLALMTVEPTILPHLGLSKFGVEAFTPIARMNADPAAIAVKSDAPWCTVEKFLAAAKKSNREMKIGNSGNDSIWQLAAASVEDKTGARLSHIPFQGAAPAVLSLLGGHIDAGAVSPAEVAPHLASGRLKVVAQKTMNETHRREAMDKLGLSCAYGAIVALKVLIPKFNLKPRSPEPEPSLPAETVCKAGSIPKM